MVRDGAAGIEVFLLQRHGLSDVLGGAYVFPGGKVDEADASPALQASLDRPPAQLHAALHEQGLAPAGAASLFVAALRETFEECGVLFAHGVTQADARRAFLLLREGATFEDVVLAASLRLSASALVPWSRWITPAVGGVIRKRFDTRFFLAWAPPGQEPAHDEREATGSAWLAPQDALRQYWDGTIALAPPQIMGLAHLARHTSCASALAEAASRPPPLVHPEPFHQGELRVICYPGDERHSVRQRALPGPTRLRHVGGRFEPDGGFEGLFRD